MHERLRFRILFARQKSYLCLALCKYPELGNLARESSRWYKLAIFCFSKVTFVSPQFTKSCAPIEKIFEENFSRRILSDNFR